MTACNHQWRRSHSNLETCTPCGKVRYRELIEKDMNEPKVIKKVDREQHNVVVPEQNHAILSGDMRRVEIEKIRREMLTLADRLDKLLAA